MSAGHQRPTIGVTGPDRRLASGRLAAMLSVRLAGGRPLWLGPSSPLSLLDGLTGAVITGGSDIDPTAYGSTDKPWSPPDVERDLFELKVIEALDRSQKPILGICRGSQLLNVHRGGNLHGDIVALRRHSRNYKTLLPKRPVTVGVHTDLATVLNRQAIRINALHHQAVRDLGTNLRVAALDVDDVVQGIEDTSRDFFIGVQWHPEYLFYARPHLRLFKALVQTASASAAHPRPS